MLTANMEVDEVMREVMQDVRWSEGWYEMNSRLLIKEMLRSAIIAVSHIVYLDMCFRLLSEEE